MLGWTLATFVKGMKIRLRKNWLSILAEREVPQSRNCLWCDELMINYDGYGFIWQNIQKCQLFFETLGIEWGKIRLIIIRATVTLIFFFLLVTPEIGLVDGRYPYPMALYDFRRWWRSGKKSVGGPPPPAYQLFLGLARLAKTTPFINSCVR